MKQPLTLFAIALVFIFFINTPASFGWGERGHQLVARGAVEVLKNSSAIPEEFKKPYVYKKEMLAHLANIPDISWKSLPRSKTQKLNPAHYIDLEFLMPQVSFKNFISDMNKAYDFATKNCAKSMLHKSFDCKKPLDKQEFWSKTGTAPWRIQQLADLMKTAYKKMQVAADNNNTKEINKHIDDILLYSGIMAHFVGDLAQPMHTTYDYDGKYASAAGLHSYFETKVVNQLPLESEKIITEIALKGSPHKKIFSDARSHKSYKSASRNSYVLISAALAINSHEHLPAIFNEDKKMLKKSKEGSRRENAKQAVKVYQDLLLDRMAVGADMLANIWYAIWLEAKAESADKLASKKSNTERKTERNAASKVNMKSRLDMSDYHSYSYQLNPDPIPVSYY